MRTRAWMLAVVCFLALCFSAPSLSVAEDVYDLRNVKWGMSKKEVIKAEGSAPILDTDSFIVFNDNIFEKNFQVAYVFVDNKLWKVRYVLAVEHTNKNDYIDDYTEFKEALTSKYGNPKKSEVVWKSTVYGKDKENYGLAISMGHLALFSVWDTPRTEVVCFIDGENLSVTVRIDYESKDLMGLAKEKRENKAKDKL